MSGADTLPDIEQLIAEFEASGMRELHVRHGGFEIYLSNDSDAEGLTGGGVSRTRTRSRNGDIEPETKATEDASDTASEADWPEGAVPVRAPYLGTFYRSPKPGSDPYVEVGDVVEESTEMCLVEVMKLFTAVRAECSGKVHSILAEDGAMVQAEQALFLVVPD